MCQYTERYNCASDYVICETCYNKNNQARSQRSANINEQKLYDMFYPLLNEHTGEARCVEDPEEYHKIQYLNMPDSEYIWSGKKRNELQKQTSRKNERITFPSDFCKKCSKKFEVKGVR